MILGLPQELGQELLNYLATRPYNEVFQLIDKLRNIQPVPNLGYNGPIPSIKTAEEMKREKINASI